MTTKFQILNPSILQTDQGPPKKFEIIKEEQLYAPPANSGKLKNMTQGRPHKCPVCLTDKPTNIFRTANNTWGCKACDNKW